MPRGKEVRTSQVRQENPAAVCTIIVFIVILVANKSILPGWAADDNSFTGRPCQSRVTANDEYLRKVIVQLQDSSLAAIDEENVRAVSEEALAAAEAALGDGPVEVRVRRFAEYLRARAFTRRLSDTNMAGDAAEHRAGVKVLLAEARTKDLDTEELALLRRLDDMSKRRVKALEEAQANFERAEKAAARAALAIFADDPAALATIRFRHTEYLWLTERWRYEEGILNSEDSLIRLVDLHAAYGDQRHAAGILEKELKAGRIGRTSKSYFRLGDLRLLMREWGRARTAFLKPAVRSIPGKLELKLAWTAFEQERWRHAETHLRRALSKGGLAAPCRARILLGHVLGRKSMSSARTEQAAQYERAARTQECSAHALSWRRYMAAELRRSPRAGERQSVPSARAQTHAVVERALSVCRTALFELTQDAVARATARKLLDEARALRAATPGTGLARRLHDFESSYLRVLARLQSGAVERATGNAELTAKAARRLRYAGMNSNILPLLQSCEDLYRRRTGLLKEADRLVRSSEDVDAILMETAYRITGSPPPRAAAGR